MRKRTERKRVYVCVCVSMFECMRCGLVHDVSYFWVRCDHRKTKAKHVILQVECSPKDICLETLTSIVVEFKIDLLLDDQGYIKTGFV